LTPDEQAIAIARLPKNTPSMKDKTFVTEDALRVFAAPAHWLFMLSYICMNIGIIGAANFLPSILFGMGYNTALSANFMSVWPNLWGAICYVGWSWHSDHTRERVWHGILPGLLATVGGALLVACAKNPPTATNLGFVSNGVRYFFIFLTSPQVGAYPVLVNYRASTLVGSTEVGLGISSVLVCQAVASIIGPFLFPNSDGPNFVPGLLASTVLYGIGSVLYALIPATLRYQNRLATKYQTEHVAQSQDATSTHTTEVDLEKSAKTGA